MGRRLARNEACDAETEAESERSDRAAATKGAEDFSGDSKEHALRSAESGCTKCAKQVYCMLDLSDCEVGCALCRNATAGCISKLGRDEKEDGEKMGKEASRGREPEERIEDPAPRARQNP